MKQLTELATEFTSVAEQSTLADNSLPWLDKLRQQALTEFSTNGWPAKKVEDWKYTSLWSLAQYEFTHGSKQVEMTSEQSDTHALLVDAYRIVLVDGVFSNELSLLSDLEPGLKISALSQSFDRVEQQLGQQVDLAKPGLTALNTLLMNEGVVITVSAESQIKKPIELVVINTGETADLATHLRHMVVLEQNSQATFIENYIGLSDAVYFNNIVTEVALAQQAKLHHYKVQNESAKAFHIATLAAIQQAESQWLTNTISLGAQLARNDLHSQLVGEQSHVTMDGLYLLNEQQHNDIHTRIDHAVPNTTSDELYKGVLDGKSHGVFNGKVMVHKDAQKTDANQSNRNLLLSRGCEIDTKPEMEIYADDVKCGHGSTVGQIDAEQLFFLRARGMDEGSARSLLTYAFAVEVLERIPAIVIKQAIAHVVEQHLPQKG